MRDILQRIRKSKGGFTLVELMVTMVLVGLLIGASAAGIFYYQKWSVWQRQEHYAKTLFLAAQSGMTQYSADKRLEQFEKTASESATAIVRQNQLLIPVTDETGQTVSVSQIWKNDGQTSSDLDSDLYYVTGTPADYAAYKSGNADAAHELLYDIFDSYLYDKTLLSAGCVSVEFDAHDGLVYSVLYSDRADALAYGSCTNTTANIINRSTANRKGSGSENSTGLCFGYYGADSLSKSNDASSKVKISSVLLNNEETLNLTWKSSSDEAGVLQMGYQVMIVDAKTGDELLEISLNDPSFRGQKTEDGYYYSIPAESADDSLKLVAAQVTSFVDGKQTELGIYPFLAYIDENLQVTLVLDAVDLDATQDVYETYRRTGEPGTLAKTLSLHRFGLEQYGVDEIRCIIQGGGAGYQITGRKQSNLEPMYFANQSKKMGSDTKDDDAGVINVADNKVSEQSTQETDSNQKTYEIQNARHLYNIRFAEIVSDAAVYAADADEKSGNNYVITKDFAWGYEESDESAGESILKKGMVYRSGLSVADADTAFPMITQLREGSSLGSFDADEIHTISYLTMSDAANAGTGSSNRFYPQGTGTALILENLGEIHDLSLYHASVNGGEYVATFCAYNGGKLANLETVGGTITAQNYAGGIFAASLPMKPVEDGALIKLINHATVTAEGMSAGIVAESSEPLVLADCVNTGVITGNIAAGITTAENEELTLIGCQNYGVILSDEDESYGITSNQIAMLTDCVGVSDPTYPIAADATKIENCWYFVSGEETLNQVLKGGIFDISLTIGEADRNGAYREQAYTDVTKEQIGHLIKQDASDVPVFMAFAFNMDESRYPIYTVRLNGVCKLSDLSLTWLGNASYQFDLWYADAADGNWKLLVADNQAKGDGEGVQVALPSETSASAVKIVVTNVTDGFDVSLGGIVIDGSWQTEGIALADRLSDGKSEETSELAADIKISQTHASDSDQREVLDEASPREKGIGTALYVKQDAELTESDSADLYTKWTALAGNLSISPLLLNTEDAKLDQDDENIRVRVWEKLRDELTDLSIFEIEEPLPEIPSGITVDNQGDETNVTWQPGLFAEKYEYEVSCYAYERDQNKNPVQTENGEFATVLLGTESGETSENALALSGTVNGTKVDRFVIRIRSVNQIGNSDWVIYQTADEQLQLPTLKYHLKLSNVNTTASDGSEKMVGYELVIENKDDYQTASFDPNRQLTVKLSTDSGFTAEFSLDQSGTIFVSDEETSTISCRVFCPGYRTSAVAEKTFSVLSAKTVLENYSVFDAKLKPDHESIGFQNEDGSLYQIATGHAKKENMQIVTAIEVMDEALGVPVLYQASSTLCSSDTMEMTKIEVGSCYQDDQFPESAFWAYPISLDGGAVELGHIVSENLSEKELLEAYVTGDGNLTQRADSTATRLIQSGAVADGYAILAGDTGYQIYYSPLLKNSTLMAYSSSEQSLYGVWRYELTEEERNVRQPEESSSEEATSSEVETTAPEETTSEETTVPEETSPQETTSEEETTSEAQTTPQETESESESETDPEPVQLTAPSLFVSEEKQDFVYPIFDKDENGNWKDSQRKATASQGSIYFDVDADKEGCAGYELSMLSFVKTKQIGRNEYEYRDALTFQLVKDDSKTGFHISGMLSTKSDGYTMNQKDTEGGFVELYQLYTDQANGIYTYLLPYYVECESHQEKVLVYAWLKQTNETDEEGNLLSTRFELFVPDGATPLGEQYAAAIDSAVISVQALAEKNTKDQVENDEKAEFLDSKIVSLSRGPEFDAFQKKEESKKEMNDSFTDATVLESQNKGFAYTFAQGSGKSEYLVQTRQWRTTKTGERECTYRMLPVYWKYDDQGINKQYFIYLPENGFAVSYYEQVNGNEPYLLYNLSICFAKIDETGLSDWSKESVSAEDGDPETFVLQNSTGLGHLKAPKLTYNQQEDSVSYPLTDENGQTTEQLQAKTTKISWSWNSDWDKLAGFETKLSFADQNGQAKEYLFDWNWEEWSKDPITWDQAYGKQLLNQLTICEKREEESSEESSSFEEQTSSDESSSEIESKTEQVTTEDQTLELTTESQTVLPATESHTPEPTTVPPATESQTPELTQPETVLPETSEALPETQSIYPEIEETTIALPVETEAEELPVPVSDEASIQRKPVILRLAAPLSEDAASKSYLFEVNAVLSVKTTLLSDGSYEYEFTLEIPKEIVDTQYETSDGEEILLMQLTNAQTIMYLNEEDSPYYEEIKAKLQP